MKLVKPNNKRKVDAATWYVTKGKSMWTHKPNKYIFFPDLSLKETNSSKKYVYSLPALMGNSDTCCPLSTNKKEPGSLVIRERKKWGEKYIYLEYLFVARKQGSSKIKSQRQFWKAKEINLNGFSLANFWQYVNQKIKIVITK